MSFMDGPLPFPSPSATLMKGFVLCRILHGLINAINAPPSLRTTYQRQSYIILGFMIVMNTSNNHEDHWCIAR